MFKILPFLIAFGIGVMAAWLWGPFFHPSIKEKDGLPKIIRKACIPDPGDRSDTYDLDKIMLSTFTFDKPGQPFAPGCEGGIFSLTFTETWNEVLYSCKLPNQPLDLYQCDLPLGGEDRFFVFGGTDGDVMTPVNFWKMPGFADECRDKEIVIVFRGQHDMAGVFCRDGDKVELFETLSFPGSRGNILLTASP